MTDAEIKKALGCCMHSKWSDKCSECFYAECDSEKGCVKELLEDTLDLLNRKQAEIERLRGILLRFMDEVAKWEEKHGLDVSELPLIPICDEGRDIIDRYRKRAIEQFAEKLKEKAEYHENGEGWEGDIYYADDVDNLVKEMVGDAE